MKPIISIVIPCYNSEKTLKETLVSILEQHFEPWEAIIVNDGSPDNLEAIALKYVEKDSRFKYFKKENGGLASARNFGIKQSKGEYILPLDSDNKIRPDFAQKAIQIFNESPNIGVVHGDAMYFGAKQGLWKVGEFELKKILLKNYIDACSIFKKNLWEEVGGYDENMPYQGNEDWDLWLAFGKRNVRFKYLNQVTFDYRISDNSMINSFTPAMFDENRRYIQHKYGDQYYKYFIVYKNLYDSIKTNYLSFFFKKLTIKIKSIFK